MAHEQFQSNSLATQDGGSGLPGHTSDPSMGDSSTPDSGLPDQQFPIGSGALGEGDQLGSIADEPSGSKLSSSVIVLGIVVVFGGLVLFWMRSMSAKNNSAMASNTEVETKIDEFLETMVVKSTDGNPDGTVLDVLTKDYTKQQVSVEDVQKNPFIIGTEEADSTGGPTTTGNPADKKQAEWERQREETKATFEAASKKIVVNSIMSGTNPLASLNGKIVRVGDFVRIGDDQIPFLVESIDGNVVSLVVESKEFDLRLGFTVLLNR